MGEVDDELAELRRRAYGPGADIHEDSAALARLRRLEGERSPKRPDVVGATAEASPVDAPPELRPSAPPTAVIPEPGEDEAAEGERAEPRLLSEWIQRLSNLRRSTVLIALGVISLVAVIVVALTLVQRVQSEPLQASASQIARLTPDSTYVIPAIFGGPAVGQTVHSHAYQEFHGLRVVVTSTQLVPSSRVKAICVSIYTQDDITDPTSTSFSGQYFSGCDAGTFPAMAQFDVRTPGLPPELRSALSPHTALQFVYDKADDEVVVFASK